MGTLVGSIAERLVSGDTVDPQVINFMRNQWQRRVSFVLKAILDGQFVQSTFGVVKSLGCMVCVNTNTLMFQKLLGTLPKQKD
uniref:Uncharacterized protein n=1 Tax=Romanomermis culicivorax TaxID=13658 RepID=A0A915I1P7_ROMCU